MQVSSIPSQTDPTCLSHRSPGKRLSFLSPTTISASTVPGSRVRVLNVFLGLTLFNRAT